jgi:hypothetical protein
MRFLDTLGIPIIAVLRDSQNFVHAAERGAGMCDLPPSRVQQDLSQIEGIVRWLDAWPERRKALAALAAQRQQREPPMRRSILGRPRFGSA